MRGRLRSLLSVEYKTNSTQWPQPPVLQREQMLAQTVPLQNIFDSVFWDTNFVMEVNGKVICFVISPQPIKKFSIACDSHTMGILWVLRHIYLVPREQRQIRQDSLKPQVRRMRSDAQKHSTSELEGSQKAILLSFLIVQMQKVRLKEGWWCPKVFSARGQSSQGQTYGLLLPRPVFLIIW